MLDTEICRACHGVGEVLGYTDKETGDLVLDAGRSGLRVECTQCKGTGLEGGGPTRPDPKHDNGPC